MKISLKWLNDFIDILDYQSKPQELATLLTGAGLEVESIEDRAKQLQNVVVGHILERNQHPDADRLTVCQVATGDGVVQQIVCGAKNHQKDDRVVVALPGAVLPGNFEIRKSKIRGVESLGMLCSEKELGLATESEGILILPPDAPIGKPFSAYRGLDDVVFEIKVTPNRADCLSHLGLARELSCLLGRPLKPLETHVQEIAASTRDVLSLDVRAVDLCPRFTGRVIRNVKVGPSPDWMKSRLEAVGLRSINNVVDVTNYVMMEMGQPLHAYDLRELEGAKIIVDRSQTGESFTTLFDQKLELTGEELMIRDERKPVGLAGVIGGANSGVKEDTQNLFIEAAYFLQSTVRRTSRKFGLQTDAAYRFSRGINVEQVFDVMNRTCRLIQEVAGGEILSQPYDVYPQPIQRNAIEITVATVSDRLGYPVAEPAFVDWMTRLGCEVQKHGTEFRVLPPAFRWDLTMDMDLVEEFGRLHGYDHIPEALPMLDESPSRNVASFDLERGVRQVLQGQGYSQALNFSFVHSQFQKGFLGDLGKLAAFGIQVPAEPVRVQNPLNEETDIMRGSVAVSLIGNLLHNFRHGNEVGRLYEVGHTFSKEESAYRQESRLALLAWGHNKGLWNKPEQAPLLVFELKTAIETLLQSLGGRNWQWQQRPAREVPEFLHPGQAASLFYEGKVVGYIGTVHPMWRDENKIRTDVAVAEFNLELLLKGQPRTPKITALSNFPVVERDLAFVMPQELAAGDVKQAMQKAAGQLLQSVDIFDFYQGEHVAEGSKSVAFRLRYQDPSGTLSDEKIQELQNSVIAAVGQKYSIQVR